VSNGHELSGGATQARLHREEAHQQTQPPSLTATIARPLQRDVRQDPLRHGNTLATYHQRITIGKYALYTSHAQSITPYRLALCVECCLPLREPPLNTHVW